jgi:CheY-like chemotaxis protein/anti-sigma regulatory factor (Ser/Thr protein kinase)
MSDDGNMELLSQARAALNSMENLLHGILDISRLDAGLDRPHIEAFSLKPLWSNIERTFVPEAIRLSLQLRLHPTDFWVASDMHLLQRVLNNLVGNALRYTSKGGVLVSARLRGDDILIQVWDTGVGIPREMQDKVFQEFFQLNNPQRDRNKGLGLGLAIVRRTLALLEHRVLLKSSPGRGSVFSVTVPRVILPSIAPALAVRTPPPDVSGLFILLVDDQESVLYAMQGLLKDWGCSVIVAQNGKVAQSALEESLREPDAMILDYRLENENGLQIAQSLHDLMGHPAPVLIVTGDIASGPILEITNSGFDVMHKPVDIYELRIWLGRIRTNLVASGEVISGFGT